MVGIVEGPYPAPIFFVDFTWALVCFLQEGLDLRAGGDWTTLISTSKYNAVQSFLEKPLLTN
jgi:hypothetical protein